MTNHRSFLWRSLGALFCLTASTTSMAALDREHLHEADATPPSLVASSESLAPGAASARDCLQVGAELTLARAYERALCASPQLHAAAFQTQAALAAKDQVSAAYRPTVNAGLTAQNTAEAPATQTVRLAANWLLYDFGKKDALLEVASSGITQAQAQVRAQILTVAFQVAQAYFDTQAAQAGVEVAQVKLRAAQEAIRLARARQAVGEGIGLDVLQAQSAVAEAELEQAQARALLHDKQAMLAMTLAIPAHLGASLKLSTQNEAADSFATLPVGGLQQLIAQAQQSRPDLLALRAQEQGLSAQVKATKAQHNPRLSLSGQMNQTHSNNPMANTGQSLVGLSLEIPIFTGGLVDSQVRELTAQHRVQHARRRQAENEAGYSIAANYHALQAASAQVVAAESFVKSARAAHRQTVSRYETGLSSMLEVFEALSKSAQAQHALIAATSKAQVTRARLAQLLGLMPSARF